MICKKDLVLFLFSHKTYVLDICLNCLSEAILTNIQNICCLVLMQYSFIISHCHLLSEGFVTFKLLL